MNQAQQAYNEKLAQHLIKRLEKRRLEASYAPTAEQAKQEVLAMIPAGSTVVRAGSVTLDGMGFWEAVAALPGVKLLDPFKPGLEPQEGIEIRRQGMTADFLVTSSNAITLDGQLVNLDATGNRVAGMIFGPKKVILVVGMNKVAPDLQTAWQRVKHYAAPIVCTRLKAKTPCAETGLCSDCSSPDRICNFWTVIEGHRFKDRLHVKMVGENLGF